MKTTNQFRRKHGIKLCWSGVNQSGEILAVTQTRRNDTMKIEFRVDKARACLKIEGVARRSTRVSLLAASQIYF